MTRQPIALTIDMTDPDAVEEIYSEPETDERDSLDIGEAVVDCRHAGFVSSCGEIKCVHCGKRFW